MHERAAWFHDDASSNPHPITGYTSGLQPGTRADRDTTGQVYTHTQMPVGLDTGIMVDRGMGIDDHSLT
ncbi:hypothetical protein SAMN05216600_10520 [Pseudomonas cuatrocienegasensis]|uniref:Uncharacterized protein n=1 Tax=Pseudomonas cuatrocienegasensis TaxID=543360 RepID=A0ABY1B9Q7_9PSED|nr:hypothetical protein A7D25_09325 [Pseudomonas sp. 21C1]SEQ31797.1 hypothetical protein SAMN05216600_10520 [Pseudomonas cuatrocienegasensis]